MNTQRVTMVTKLAAENFDTNSVETDIQKTFARVLRSRAKANAPINAASDPRTSSPDASARLNAIPRCSPSKPSAIADASVWLECSGELIDVRSVDVLRIREATPGIELTEFVCPRCRTPHASLRFG